MKDKKGFTLIELLAVIAILGIILAIAGISVSSIMKNAKSDIDETTKENIKHAAELYLTENYLEIKNSGKNAITINDLVDNGYLKEIPRDSKGYNLSGDINIEKNTDGSLKISNSIVTFRVITLSNIIKKSNNIKTATDFDGNKAYYYIGTSNDNYVSFAGYTWRILRINGDGTIRLILNSNYSGAVSWNNLTRWYVEEKDIWNGSPMQTLIYEFGNKFNGNSNVVNGKFCYEEVTLSSIPTSATSFTCNNDIVNQRAGTLSLSEALMYNVNDSNRNNSFAQGYNYFLSTIYKNGSASDYILVASRPSYPETITNRHDSSGYPGYVKPVINLKSDVQIKDNDANGTSSKPYVIK